MHITMYCESCNAVNFERFSVVLGHFSKASRVKHLLVTKLSFLRKWASTLIFGIFNTSETKRIKDNTASIRYISINFDRRFNRKKGHNSLFLREQTQKTRNILKHFTFALIVASNCYNCWRSQRRATHMNYYGGSSEALHI